MYTRVRVWIFEVVISEIKTNEPDIWTGYIYLN